MPKAVYSGPVSNLLPLGSPQWHVLPEDWINYPVDYGLSRADIPDLIGLATDADLATAEFSADPAVYGPVHAWRALAQLGAMEAAEPLLGNFKWVDYDIDEDLGYVYAMLGPATIPVLANHIKTCHTEDTAIYAFGAVSALNKVARTYPETQPEIFKVLTDQLEQYQENDPALNDILDLNLTDLGAKESLPIIDDAFAVNRISSVYPVQYFRFKLGAIDEAEFLRFWPPNRAREQPESK